MRPGFVIMPLPEAAEAGSEVLGGLWGVWWLGFRRSEVWPGFVVMALAEGIEAGGKPLAVSGTSVGRPCFGRVGHFACFRSLAFLSFRWSPEPSGRSREMGAGQMNPVGQDADMQKAAFRVERPPCKVFPGSSAFCWAGSVQPVGNAVQTDQVVNRLARADDGEIVALDQNFGRQGTGVVGR